MGCAQSKIENEEAVTRCKERKQFLKEAVKTRNFFAATHSAYVVALRHTGAALSDYGEGEVDVFHHNHHDTLLPSSASSSSMPVAPRDNILPPPPPPLPNFGPPKPLQRAATMPEFSIPKPDLKPTTSDTIEEEEIDGDDDDEEEERNGLSHRRRSRKIASEEIQEEPPPPMREPSRNPVPPPPESSSNTTSVMDYFFAQDMPMSSLSEVDEIQSFKDDNRSNYDNGFVKKSDDVHIDKNSSSDTGKGSSTIEVEVVPKKPVEVKPVKKTKQYVQSSSMDVDNRSGKGLNMLDILKQLDESFLRASQSASEVSKLLEANRLHFHSNFADNRGHIDHSKRVMQVITWNKSFRGMPEADDEKDEIETEETLASVLDKILAWEKKLYEEIKVGEVMKFDYQKKVALLNRQKSRNTSYESLEKTKAAVSHLHTRYIVDMQTLDSTVTEIDTLRDEHLYPKLVSLVDGMAKMWETMNHHHRNQWKMVADIKSLDISNAPLETSVKHHQCTVQLCDIVQDWYSQLKAVMGHKKEFVRALNSWLKLNLIPLDSSLKEKDSSPPRGRLPIQSLLLAWQEHLEKIPDELGRSAISSFAHVIKNIVLHQEDEIKMRMTCDETRKELSRRTRAFEDWYHKNKDIERPDDANHKDSITARKIQLEMVKNRLEEEEAAYRKQCRQVRDKSTLTLKTQLPELFRAMSDFTTATTIMYQKLQSIAKSQKNPKHT